jgi:hypothetical protein
MSHQQTIQRTEFELKEMESKTRNMYNKLCKLRRCQKISVSDHAIVRYLERVHSATIEQACENMLTQQVVNYYHELGDGTYPTGNGSTRVVIKNAVIVTVIN